MGLFARAKEPFLRSFLKLFNGLPSHDVTPAKLRAWPHYFLHRLGGARFKLCVNPPEDLDGLSPSQLKGWSARPSA